MHSQPPSAGYSNGKWYPYPELGSYFRLLNGVLLQKPMLQDGGMAEEEAEVDWVRGVSEDELPKIKDIAKELGTKL